MKNLDLNTVSSKVWNVTMIDGTQLNICKPSQKQLLILSSKSIKLNEVESMEDKLKILNEITTFILNNNQEGITYKAEEIQDLSMDVMYAIYSGYTDFIKEQ